MESVQKTCANTELHTHTPQRFWLTTVVCKWLLWFNSNCLESPFGICSSLHKQCVIFFLHLDVAHNLQTLNRSEFFMNVVIIGWVLGCCCYRVSITLLHTNRLVRYYLLLLLCVPVRLHDANTYIMEVFVEISGYINKELFDVIYCTMCVCVRAVQFSILLHMKHAFAEEIANVARWMCVNIIHISINNL